MSGSKPTLAVYGAAFNPPHAGHLDAVRQLLADNDRVLLVPAYSHAFGKAMAPFEARLDMLRAALGASDLPPDRVLISDIEQQLGAHKTPVYSWDLMAALSDRNPELELVLAIGPDNAQPEQWQRFYRYRDIDAQWRKQVVQERLAVRSTRLRQLVAEGAAIDPTLLPSAVQRLIAQWQLYREG